MTVGGRVCHGNDHREQKLRNEIAKVCSPTSVLSTP
jgi:hypothetical protein